MKKTALLACLLALSACDATDLLDDTDAGPDDTIDDPGDPGDPGDPADTNPPPDMDPPPAGVMSYQVAPTDTDPAISQSNRDNCAYAPAPASALNRLLIFFSGTSSSPAMYTRFLAHAAGAGMHVIGVDYPNSMDVHDICLSYMTMKSQMTCFGDVRQATWLGGMALSGGYNMPMPDSQHNRVVKLLQYLDAQHPGDGWNQYLAGDEVNWSHVTVAGHSQGGGSAAYIGFTNAVDRVVMFSSVFDAVKWKVDPGPTTAPYLTGTPSTSIDRFFGFDHTGDVKNNLVMATWLGMHLGGSPTSVDPVDSYDYASSNLNQLTTSQTSYGPTDNPIMIASPHYQIVNNAVPVLNGIPVFQATWDYLLGVSP